MSVVEVTTLSFLASAREDRNPAISRPSVRMIPKRKKGLFFMPLLEWMRAMGSERKHYLH